MFSNSNLWQFNKDKSKLEYTETQEIENAYKELFNNIFNGINTEPNTPAGQIITSLVEIDTATISAIQDLVNTFFLGGSGNILDNWANTLYRIKRKQAQKGSVLIDIQGIPNTIIPKGFVVSDGTLQYESQEESKINPNGKAQLTFLQVEASESISIKNTITQIVSNVNGIEAVNNPNSSNAGVLVESDSELYARALNFGSIYKNSSYESILANIANLQGVKKIAGYENYTNQEVVYKGITITPHSFALVVLGGDDNEIAQTICNSKPPGAGMVGDVKVSLEILDKEYEYSFYRPTNKSIVAQVICETNIYSPASYQQIVKNAIIQYIDSLNIGDVITQPNLSNAIVAQADGFNISDVKIGIKDGDPASYQQIELNLNELATISETDIQVGTD